MDVCSAVVTDAEAAELVKTRQPTTGLPAKRWATAFLVRHADRVFLFNEKSDLVIARLSPEGYREVSRAHLLEPTTGIGAGERDGQAVVWSHPAFANRSVYARIDPAGFQDGWRGREVAQLGAPALYSISLMV